MRFTVLVLAAMLALPGVAAAAPAKTPVAAPRKAPTLRFIGLASFDSLRLAGPGAWSPRGARLALVDPAERVVIVDTAAPKPRHVTAAGAPVSWVSWSPDGAWLAMVVGEPDSQCVVAVPAAGGAADTLLRWSTFSACAWAPDGKIYCWIGHHRQVLDPPSAWTGARAAAAVPDAAPPVVEATVDLALRLRHWVPGMGEEVLVPGAVVTIGLDPAHHATIRAVDMLPDGSRSIVGLARGDVERWLLVGPEGRTILDLRALRGDFQPTSISADRRRVAGFAGRWSDGHWRDARLLIADAAGAWTAPLVGATSGLGPQWSREGSWIAFLEPISGATRVGGVVATP